MRLLPLLLLFPTLALAGDIAPARTRVNNRCTSYAMCVAEAGTGECQDASNSDEIVLQVGRFAHYTFYSTKSNATDYTCNIFTSNEGFTAATATDQVNTASITDEAPVYTMAVLLRHFWINCSAIADNSVTLDVTICAME